ncbi:MAG: hypothetical protein HY438_01465 [DPANN group archaeon]|nr:hypothetical protein [DPANN group archaeon]
MSALSEFRIEDVLNEIRVKGSSLGLSGKVISESESVCMRAVEKKSRPYDLQAFVAACITAACKVNRVAMTPYLIVRQPNAYLRLVNGMVTSLKNSLNLDTEELPPQDYLPKFFAEVEFSSGHHLSKEFRVRAFEILEQACEKKPELLTTKWPDTYAAGAIYAVIIEYKLPISQEHIWSALGVDTRVLSKKYRELADLLAIKLNPLDKPKGRPAVTITESRSEIARKNQMMELKEQGQ